MKHKENILKLRAEGKTYREIQQQLGCSKSTISYHLGYGQKEKTHRRTRERRKDIRKRLIDYKSGIPCLDCGKRYPHYIMDFDHVSGQKISSVSSMIKWGSWDEILEEINKCELVCSNCHRERTWQRKIKH